MRVSATEAERLIHETKNWSKSLTGGASQSHWLRYAFVAMIVAGLLVLLIPLLFTGGRQGANTPSRLVAADGCTYETVVTQPCSGPCNGATRKVKDVSTDPACPDKPEREEACQGYESAGCSCSMDSLKQELKSRGIENYDFCASPDGSASVCDNADAGDRCYLGCKDGFSAVGEQFATCLSNGSWDLAQSPQTFGCKVPQKECPNLFNDDTAFFSGNCVGAKPGDECTMNCHVGSYPKDMVIKATCGQDYQWSNDLQCLPQTC